MEMRLSRVLKKLGKESLIYGVSAAVGRFVSLLLAPVVTRIFAPEDYGVIALIHLAIGFAIILGGMNIGSGIGFHFFKREDPEERGKVLLSGFFAIVATAVLMSGMLALFAPQIASLLQIRNEGPIVGHDLVLYIQVGALGMFFALMQAGLVSMLRYLEKPYHYMAVQLTNLCFTVGSVLVLVVYLRIGVIGVFWGGVIGPIAGFLCSFAMLSVHLFRIPTLAYLGPILIYALPQLPAAILNWMQTQLGRFCINAYVSLREQGLYSIGLAIASILVLATTAFRLAYDPFALSIMKKPDAPKLFAKLYKFYVCFFGILLSFLAALGKPILQVLTPLGYHDAHFFVPFLAAGLFYLGASNILATGIWISGKTIYTSYAQGIAFAFLVAANLVLVPVYGGMGAALAFLLGNVLYNFFVYYFSQRIIPISYRYWRTHAWVLLIVLFCWWESHLVAEALFLEALGIGLACGLVGSLLVFKIFVTKEDLVVVKRFIRNLRQGRLQKSQDEITG